MKELLVKYKSVVRFILVFLSVYMVLTFGYKMYLEWSDGSKFYPDYVTNVVAKQSAFMISVLGYNTEVLPHPNELSMKLIVNSKFIARIVEGCNSVSVIILFVSFVIAFTGRIRETVVFLFMGSVLIYVVNIIRIAVLSIGLYEYPWRKDLLHTVIFPMIIYGMVFTLWMFWVNRFSKQSRNYE